MIAAAMVRVAWTRIAGTMLGRMWWSAIRQGGLPMARAASTNSSAATACTWARVSRTKIEVAESPIATMALVRLGRGRPRARWRGSGRGSPAARRSAHDRPVDDAAGIARQHPERQAERDGERHRGQARPQRGPGAEDDAREHVAPDLVGAEGWARSGRPALQPNRWRWDRRARSTRRRAPAPRAAPRRRARRAPRAAG